MCQCTSITAEGVRRATAQAQSCKVIAEQKFASQKCGHATQKTQSQAATILHLRLFQRGLATDSSKALLPPSTSHLATTQFFQVVVMALQEAAYCENQSSSIVRKMPSEAVHKYGGENVAGDPQAHQ